jgi:signal transduction histidine kinase/ligand-binding sensor domain-containing protein
MRLCARNRAGRSAFTRTGQFLSAGPRAFLLALALFWAAAAHAVVLWSDLGSTLAHDTGPGTDILGGAVKRDDSSTNILYFKFHVDPMSDKNTEDYFAAFQLYEGDEERLGIGNSLKAYAYSAFNTAETGPKNDTPGDFDLRSSRPELNLGVSTTFELPTRGVERTIVFKVEYVAGGPDRITIWLNPDLAPGATEADQPEALTTKFTANASFDQIRLRQGGGGGGWTFSDMAIATSFNDFVAPAAFVPGEPGSSARHGALAFSFLSWQREQGLPQTSVRALAQTHDGYIWVGTDEGIARFDGLRFVSFGWREGLRSGPVRHLYEDTHGALWIGSTAGGLTRWQDGQFTTFTVREGLPADSITALAEDGAGSLWGGTEAGLVKWENGRFAVPDGASKFTGHTITALFKDRPGTLWLGVLGAGIFHVADGKFVPVTEPSLETLLRETHSLLVDHTGRLWVGAGDDFVLCRENGQWLRYRIPRHLAQPYVGALTETPDGTIWAGSVSEGLFQFREGNVVPINATSGILDNFIEALLVDREGSLWVGTGAGLNQLRPKKVIVFGPSEGLGYGAVLGLTEIAPGLIWAGKPGDGLYRWDGKSFSRLAPSGLSRNDPQVNALLTSRDGSCWVGCGHGLLHFKQPKSAPDEAELAGLAGLNVLSLTQDRQGAILAGTREGQLWRLSDGRWLAQTNLWQTHAIAALVYDKDGALWVGTEGRGLYRFGAGAPAHFTKGKGLLSDLIRTLYLDPQGTIWIGTAGGGLARWRDGSIATITTREGLPDDTISQILPDESGRLWLGNNRGIACLTPDEFEQVASARLPAFYPRVYGRAEGMLSEECSGGGFPAGLKTQSGLLWFSTLKGIVVVDPRPRTTALPPPTVVVEEVQIDGVPVPPANGTVGEWVTEKTARASKPAQSGAEAPGQIAADTPTANPPDEVPELRIRPGKHRVELRYTGMSFNAPERVRFRYRLENLDPDWVEAGTRRTAFYNYIPPGNYRFRVIACNSDGVWNEAGASLALSALPYPWQTWWVRGLGAMVLLLSVGGSVRMVEKRKSHRRLQRIEQERALERERARIAQDLHDDLGSSLTRISLLSGLAKADRDNPGQVEIHAEKISESAAQTVRALEEIVWAVRPGSDSLQSLVEYIAHFANEHFDGASTRCRLDLPHDLPAQNLPPEMRHNLFLIVKEALTNALKHAGAREVHIQAKVFRHSMEIIVQDDGRGFTPGTPVAEGKRHGLGNMRQRAASIGADLRVESTPGKGTTVRLAVDFPGG